MLHHNHCWNTAESVFACGTFRPAGNFGHAAIFSNKFRSERAAVQTEAAGRHTGSAGFQLFWASAAELFRNAQGEKADVKNCWHHRRSF